MEIIKTVILTEMTERGNVTSTYRIWSDETYERERYFYDYESKEVYAHSIVHYDSYEAWSEAIQEEAWGATLFTPVVK